MSVRASVRPGRANLHLPKHLLPKQESLASVSSAGSIRGKKGKMKSIRATIRGTFRGKKAQSTRNKIFLKRTEYLNYSSGHIKKLEESLAYFNVIRRSHDDPEFIVQMDDVLKKCYPVFESIFKEYEEIIEFQRILDRDIRVNIDKADETLNTLTRHSTEMKFRYANYTRHMEECLALIKKHRGYFKMIRQHTDSKLMLNDELSRPIREVGNLKLYFSDFIKCSKKDGRNTESAVYTEMLKVLDNIGKTIDDALLLQQISGLPRDFKIEAQGCCVKSGAITYQTYEKGFLRKLMGLKARISFNPGYMFLFEECLIICTKIQARKRRKKHADTKEKYKKEALIAVSDLLDFLDHDYNEDDATLNIIEKNTGIAHIINFDSEDTSFEWNDKIVEQATFCQERMNHRMAVDSEPDQLETIG